MALQLVNPDGTVDEPDWNSTIYTASTPPESVAAGLQDDNDDENDLHDDSHFNSGGCSSGGGSGAAKPSSSSKLRPRPGHTVLIKSVASGGAAITLRDGKIALAHEPDDGSSSRASHWVVCEDRPDASTQWLGFRNAVSGRFLGRDKDWRLCCDVTWHREWEKFRVRERPGDGLGSVLLMTHWWTVRPVGMANGGLAMVENWGEVEEMGWEFVEV